MIVVKYFGGLGNQLFQYATGTALARQHGTSLLADTSWYQSRHNTLKRSFLLNSLRIHNQQVNDQTARMFFPKSLAGRVRNHFLVAGNRMKILTEQGIRPYNSQVGDAPADTYLNGYWQSEKYFYHIRQALLPEVQPLALGAPAREAAQQIKNTVAVSMHVRRADYLLTEVHGTCTPDYYRRAYQVVNANHPVQMTCIFSDDMDWCRQQLSWVHKPVFIEGMTPAEDLYLMSLCRHNIIANSSFSWWAAWLNQFPQKQVVAPEKWFNDPLLQNQSFDMVPDSWARM